MADPKTIRVLLIDDDPTMVALLRGLLNAMGYGAVSVAATAKDALGKAAGADLIILDYQLPDSTGIALLPQLLARPQPPSVVMVTGAGNETLAAAALRAGAEDYLPKDGTLRELFPQIIERVRRTRALREAQAAAEQELVRAERLAAIGEMTVTLHHEINNPLMTASAEVELLLASRLPPDQHQSLESVRSSLQRIGAIVKQVGELRQAESTDYLTGLKMITLSGHHAAAAQTHGKALLWIPDRETAQITALLLRHAGFSVERLSSAAEVEAAAGQLGVSLVVVSGTGNAAGAEALGGFRPSPQRQHVVAALVAGTPDGVAELGVDCVITLPFDPATLTAELVAAVEARR